MKTRISCIIAVFAACVFTQAATAKDKTLDIYWTDVEGGAATLIVTPNGESVLIDSGNPGTRDAERIFKTTQVAGITNIDHYITTHFHVDHFGGAAELSKRIPIRVVYDNGIPTHDPDGGDSDRFAQMIKPYREFKAEQRKIIKPGDAIPIAAVHRFGAPKLSLTCVGTMKVFYKKHSDRRNLLTGTGKEKDPDTSDNKNSVVLLLRYGAFDFFAAGDLTWNAEAEMVTPKDPIGIVDVYQVTHHGLDLSNNPLVLNTLQPTVAIMSNGTTKGCEPGTFATLKNTPSILEIFQIHKNLRIDVENNADIDNIANLERNCQGNYIKLSVSPSGWNYTVSIPATGRKQTFYTK